ERQGHHVAAAAIGGRRSARRVGDHQLVLRRGGRYDGGARRGVRRRSKARDVPPREAGDTGMSFNLFEEEEATIARAHALIEAGGSTTETVWAAYAELLKDFENLLKTTRRLVRVSDRNEAGLNAMAEKQRLAAEELVKKNRELEVLSNKLSKYLAPQV